MTPSEEFEADPFERVVNLRAELRHLINAKKDGDNRRCQIAQRGRLVRKAMQARLDSQETIGLADAIWKSIAPVIIDEERHRVATSALNAAIREIEAEIKELEDDQ